MSSQLIRHNAGLNFNFSQPSTQIIEVDDDEEVVTNAIGTSVSGADNHSIYGDKLNNGYNGRYFVFTVNNPNTKCQPYISFGDIIGEKIGVSYAIWCLEEGKSHTRHLQGYMQLKSKSKLAALRNKLAFTGGWFCSAKGTAQQNIDYISHTGKHSDKPGLLEGPWSIGECVTGKGMGSRSDIDDLVNSIKNGKSVKQLCEQHTNTMLKYFSNATKIQQVLNVSVRRWRTELFIYTGVAGSGKSYKAHKDGQEFLNSIGKGDEIPYDVLIPKKGETLWFQDYTGQSVVIFDDFYGSIDIDTMKRLIDEYPVKVNMKNGHGEFLARRVYITSNIGWRNWWASDLLSNSNNENAIVRRITGEQHFTEVYNPDAPVVMLNNQDINLGIGEIGDLACFEDPADLPDYARYNNVSPKPSTPNIGLMTDEERAEWWNARN